MKQKSKFTPEQIKVIDQINLVVDEKPKIARKLAKVIPQTYETYEEWPKSLWKKAIQFLKEHNLYTDPTWQIYIPEEGHWPIHVKNNATYEQAKAAYLKWANRKRLPAGSGIDKF